ncbi:DUF2262 domain-containing protein [Pseudogracilibacillus auburnensis]|uniref:DUF2262 domain-containing protein n=1 Tax=Pseudogracilibacillus auburnensis TaxID=1494959 RepID=A0A2V3W8H6_9BACI|nr:DUF2262 domain-containing protein [Pseudogracilibacillus auburnensis]MBO1001238.1 DUF2262 domain-containing protein [Pseudogracilibacillus auburnensis]PXW90673.1 hypothetical protein DFR56_101587 [Pseudogracilibacillus auburnensis]
MEKTIQSELIGLFTYNEICKTYEQNDGKIHWSLDIRNEGVNVNKLLKKAEELFLFMEDFDKKAKVAIAEKLIDYKNDSWPEYDENDENLNWDVVDAGEYDVTKEKFAEVITLYDIVIRVNDIYCEFDDGDLFGGHRIHAYFDDYYELLNADV